MAIWHDDVDLKGRFHPQHPDDLQVVVHEGSFRFTDTKPEVMWAHVVARLEWTHQSGENGYAYRAVLLNQPHQLKTLKQNDEILFVAKQSYKLPIRVTHEYIMQRAFYDIRLVTSVVCQNCLTPYLNCGKNPFPLPRRLIKANRTLCFPRFAPYVVAAAVC